LSFDPQALVLRFRSSCKVSDVSGRGACSRAPAWPCAQRRYNPALSPARPLPPVRSPSVGRTRRPLVGRAFRALNAPFRPARRGLVASPATGDAGPSPGTCAARVGRPHGAGNDARRAGGTENRTGKRTGVS